MYNYRMAAGAIVFLLTSLVAGCGGGGGGGGNGGGGPNNPPDPPPNPGPFTIGGSVSGLAANATGLMVTNNGSDERAINANGTFAFATPLPSGGSYDIRVMSQPYDPYQNCVVTNGSGVVGNAAVTAPTITCTTYVSKFATSIDFASASYSQYAIDASTGQLRARGFVRVGRNPVDVGAFGFHANVSFVVSRGDALLHSFLRDPVSGRLTEGPNSPQPVDAIPAPDEVGGTGVSNLTVHPRLPFVYVSNGGGKTTVSGFRFDPNTAALTPIPGSPFTGGARPNKLVIDSTGRFAYLANRDSNDVTPYTIDQATGALVPNGSALPIGEDVAVYPVIHPSGKFLYVPTAGETSSIAAFAIGASGMLTPVANSPFATTAHLTSPVFLHPSGKYLFFKTLPPNNVPGSVNALAIDQNTGALSMIGTPVEVGIAPQSFATEPSGRYLFVSNRGPIPRTGATPGSISVVRINAATGELTALSSVATPAPYSVNLDWSGKYLYSASADGNAVHSFRFNVETGALTPIPDARELIVRGTPVSLLSIPSAAGEPAKFQSKFAYAADFAGSRIAAYSINTSGVVTPTTGAGPSAELASVGAVAIMPHSRRLLAVTSAGAVSTRAFAIDSATGALGTSATAAAAGIEPWDIAAEPSGRFAYVADRSGSQINVFGIDASTGDLTALPSSAVSGYPQAVAVHPNGRFLYYVTNSDWGMRTIDTDQGTLFGISGGGTGGSNSAIAIHPSGRFAYVTRTVLPAGKINVYRIRAFGVGIGQFDGSSETDSLGVDPRSIAIHPGGRFVYVGNSASANVAAFRVSEQDGSLSAIGAPTVLSSNPTSVRADYSGNFLYVVDSVSQVRTFAIDQTTGQLTATAPTGPQAPAAELEVSEDIE